MKKFILFILGFAFSLTVLGEGKYKIKVKIDGAKDSLCILAVYYGDKQYVKDTGYVNSQGYYVFEGTEELDRGMYIVAGQKKNTYFEFLISEDKEFVLETDTIDLKGHITVQGCEENELFFTYLDFLNKKQEEAKPIVDKLKNETKEKEKKRLKEQLGKISEEVENYQQKVIEENKNTFTATFIKATLTINVPDAPKNLDQKEARKFQYNYYKDHYWDNIELNDDGLIRTPFFDGKLKEYFEKVLLQLPDTITYYGDMLIAKSKNNKEMYKYLIWYLTRLSETSKIMGMDKAFVHFAEKYYGAGEAYWADDETIEKITKRAKQLKNLLVGAKAPDMKMVDTSYRTVTIYKTPADYLFVFFYDPDCGHCKKEIAKLRSFYKDYKSKGVEVIAIFSEADVEYWKKFVREQNLEWINVINGYNIDYHDLFDIISTPVIYLLDNKKKILTKKLSADQNIDFIKHSLGEEVEKKEDDNKTK